MSFTDSARKYLNLVFKGREAVIILLQDARDRSVSTEELDQRIGKFFEEYGINPNSNRGKAVRESIYKCREQKLSGEGRP